MVNICRCATLGFALDWMSDESSFAGLNPSKELAIFSSLNATLVDADSPFKDLRTLTKTLSVEGSDAVYFEEVVRGSLEGRTIALKSCGKSTKKKPSLDELKSYYAESPIHRNTMRVELKVLKTLEVPSPQDASGLILNNTDLEHSVEQRLGVLAEEKMMENFPLNNAFKRSNLIMLDKGERSRIPGCKGSYCEYVFNAMSLLAKRSFSKCHSQIAYHRAVLFQVPRKWLDQDKEDMLMATALARPKLKIQERASEDKEKKSENSPVNDATILPRINQGASCVGSPIKQKKSESPAAFMHCRSSAASYDTLNVCENCFKIYGALHNMKKHQEYHKKNVAAGTVVQNSASNSLSLNPNFFSSTTAEGSESLIRTPEQKKSPSSIANPFSASPKFSGSPNHDLSKSSSWNASTSQSSSPLQNAAKSNSPLNRSRSRLGQALGASSTLSDSSESGVPPTVDMDWRIKNFSQKQAAGKLIDGPLGKRDLGIHHNLDSDLQTLEELSSHEIAHVHIPVVDSKDLSRLLKVELIDRMWDDPIFQRELQQEKYYFDLCRNYDGKVGVLVVVENELTLLSPKQLLGMLAVNMKMPGFVNFSLLKPTFNQERKLKRAVAEAKSRARSMSMVTHIRRVPTIS
jgi:hypothetical protein